MPYSIDCNMEDPYFHLLDIIDKNIVFYFFIDYWNRDFIVYKARMSDIHIFIGDCEGLDEYYLVTEDFMELYSITDHDDLLYIDVRKNKMKVDNVCQHSLLSFFIPAPVVLPLLLPSRTGILLLFR